MSQLIHQLLQQVTRSDAAFQARHLTRAADVTPCLTALSSADAQQFWNQIVQLQTNQQLDTIQLEAQLIRALSGRISSPDSAPDNSLEPAVHSILQVYRQAQDSSWRRHLLLLLLLKSGGAEGWRGTADCLAVDPPSDPRRVLEVYLAIWRSQRGPVAELFPRLLDTLQHPDIAPLTLDLANDLSASGRLGDHPARSRAEPLAWLLRQLVERLEDYEQSSCQQGVRDLQLAHDVHASIRLAIALVHTLALLEHRDAAGTFHRLLQLQHRRLRVEAAGGLARLAEPAGLDSLCQLAADPLVRRQAVGYATELGQIDRIAASLRSPQAMAEGELTERLAESDLFGVPPSGCELVDQRQLAWPGYDEPRGCYLFRFWYHLADGDRFTNVAIVGPLAHAFTADLTRLSPAEAYAIYAGWHVEHPQIVRHPIDPTQADQDDRVAQLVARATERGFRAIEPIEWGQFLERRLVIATATSFQQPGTLLIDELDCYWMPHGNPQRPIGPELAFARFVGTQLLRQFNPEYDDWPS